VKCIRLKLVNFCNHRSKEVFFHNGMTGIFGTNGSGKSTLVVATRFALTGKNDNNGNKAANACDLADPSEVSYVELEVEHGDEHFTVRRNIRPTRPTALLTLANGEVIDGDEKVTAKIEEILSIKTDIINDIVIVGQRDIFGFLDANVAKRSDQFQRLFHTDKANTVFKDLGDHLKSLTIPSVGVDIDQLRQRIELARQTVERLQPTLQQMPTFEEIQRQRDGNAEVVRIFDNVALLCQRLDGLRQQQTSLQQNLQTTTVQRDAIAAELTRLTELLASKHDQTVEVRATLSRLAQHQQLQRSHESIAKRLQVIHDEQTAAFAALPDRPISFEEPEQLLNRSSGLGQEIRHLERFLQSFDTGVTECPTCGTPVTTLAPKLEEHRQRIAFLLDEFQKNEAKLQECRRWAHVQQQYQLQTQARQRENESLQLQLAALPPVTQEQVDEVALQRVLDEAGGLQRVIEQHQKQLQQISNTVARDDGTLIAVGRQILDLQSQIATQPAYTVEQRQQAIDYVAQWDQQAVYRRQQESELAIAGTTLHQSELHLQEALAVEARAVVLREWQAHASAIRDVLHKDAAPRFVAQNNLELLQHQMNEYLVMFDADYRVEAAEGLSFMAHLVTGSHQPGERLSEGQKVILALSFRLALNLMFAENIGALYLDEPTAYLDERHIQGFAPVLQQLRAFSASRGLQCIIVTHEQSLAPLFDHVIRL
jgi:DNA repair exonuclease SbcCD ATPase subunit